MQVEHSSGENRGFSGYEERNSTNLSKVPYVEIARLDSQRRVNETLHVEPAEERTKHLP